MTFMKLLQGVRLGLRRTETLLAGLSLLLMLLLTLGQIIARNFFETGIPAADTLTRYLVLYIAFFGAAMATDTDQHIKIDVLSTFLNQSWIRRLHRPLQILGAIVTGLFAHAAYRLWWDEWQFVSAHEKWTVVLMGIIPLGFALLCLHFLLDTIAGQDSDQAPSC